MTEQTPKNAREAAVLALLAVEQGAFSELAIAKYGEAANLSPRDMALAAKLVYGTLQNRYLCDFYIAAYSSLRLKKIQPSVRLVLETAVYQIVFLDKIPDSAAVNESVALLRRLRLGGKAAAGFVNGVLRSIVREKERLPVLNCATKEEYYSKQYSHPLWMVEAFVRQFGREQTKAFLAENNRTAPVCLRINALKTTPEEVQRVLTEMGVAFAPHPAMENLLLCGSAGSVLASPLFSKGYVTVQDGASMTAVEALSPAPGEFVLDCCASPGGKSFYMSERMKNTGKILACDILERKLEPIRQGALRLGVTNLETRRMDATVPEESLFSAADCVLCDVPCSALGIIRKKPEIRYKTEEALAKLPETQRNILNNAARYVKPGGTLVYSTCTVLERENLAVVRSFLKENREFCLKPFVSRAAGPTPGYITLLPNLHNTDGFFVAKLERMDYDGKNRNQDLDNG